MKAILVGLGGIGRNVYYPQLINLGFDVTTADLYDTNADYQNVTDAPGKFEVGIVNRSFSDKNSFYLYRTERIAPIFQ